jgi:catechol 2,3-dioxygenase-like lactoylglutathione lyase family enzyme
MPASDPERPVLQLRVALTASDFERMTRFYTEGLGIQPAAFFQNDGGHAVMLDLGQATLEIFDEAQALAIDQLEAGGRVSGQVRLALQVPDLDAATERLLARGASLVHEPVHTPWGDYNVRLRAPDGMQITLFQVPKEGRPIGS